MDNLDRDVIAAAKEGKSYGQWKAEHPNTNPDRLPEDEVPDGAKTAFCRYCKKEFIVTRTTMVLCSDECRRNWSREYNREYARRAKEESAYDDNDIFT